MRQKAPISKLAARGMKGAVSQQGLGLEITGSQVVMAVLAAAQERVVMIEGQATRAGGPERRVGTALGSGGTVMVMTKFMGATSTSLGPLIADIVEIEASTRRSGLGEDVIRRGLTRTECATTCLTGSTSRGVMTETATGFEMTLAQAQVGKLTTLDARMLTLAFEDAHEDQTQHTVDRVVATMTQRMEEPRMPRRVAKMGGPVALVIMRARMGDTTTPGTEPNGTIV